MRASRSRYELGRTGALSPALEAGSRHVLLERAREAFGAGRLHGSYVVHRVAYDGHDELHRTRIGIHDRTGFLPDSSTGQLTMPGMG